MSTTYRLKTYEIQAIKFTGTDESLNEVKEFVNGHGKIINVFYGDLSSGESKIYGLQYVANNSWAPSWIIYEGDYIYIDEDNYVIVSTKHDFLNKFEEVNENA